MDAMKRFTRSIRLHRRLPYDPVRVLCCIPYVHSQTFESVTEAAKGGSEKYEGNFH